MSLARIGAVITLAHVISVVSVHAQAPALEGKTAEQAYKNIQVLNGTPAVELNQSMHLIKAAVGADCEYCHTGDRASDAKKPKQIARDMMRLAFDINKNAFEGRQVVTCYTCHRGVLRPVGLPVLPVSDAPGETVRTLPSADVVLARYVEALGGEQAIRKISTRVITATEFIATGPGGTIPVPAQLEQYRKAPNLALNVYRTPGYTISDGFDGTTQWGQDAAGRVTEALKIDQTRARRAAMFYECLDLKRQYRDLTVSGIENVNGRDAYLVIANPAEDRPERLYFDTQTGLLLRKLTVLPTPVGDSPFQVDYDDYRDAGAGVKLPFVLRMNPATPRTELAPSSTLRVQKVQENVPVDDAKFSKPQPKATPAN
jgi:hypothetical protein